MVASSLVIMKQSVDSTALCVAGDGENESWKSIYQGMLS